MAGADNIVPGRAAPVGGGILRRWPVTNCQKEVLLIDELEEIVDALDQRQFDALAAPICSRIARCATSCSSQVAERALYVWNNERFLEMASAGGAMERILPPFVASVEDNLERHWSKCVQQVTASVKALLLQRPITAAHRSPRRLKLDKMSVGSSPIPSVGERSEK
uniref:Uncharacterized protein n=1 Tax=Aegilops tauschii TaxID=37682 RepID=R7VZ95_AEGTA